MMAQQTDPTLTGAVIAQSGMLKKIFKDREKTQKKIIAAETAVTVAMDRMHKEPCRTFIRSSERQN